MNYEEKMSNRMDRCKVKCGYIMEDINNGMTGKELEDRIFWRLFAAYMDGGLE
jgi:hypothetical protein